MATAADTVRKRHKIARCEKDNIFGITNILPINQEYLRKDNETNVVCHKIQYMGNKNNALKSIFSCYLLFHVFYFMVEEMMHFMFT